MVRKGWKRVKPIIVSIKSLQRDEKGESQTLELVSEGKYYKKERSQYIVYKESAISSLEGVTTTIKVLADGTVCVLRTGAMQQRQEFRPGMETTSWYDTPLGRTLLIIKTYACRVQLVDGIGTIEIEFDVTITGMGALYNQLTITVQEDKTTWK